MEYGFCVVVWLSEVMCDFVQIYFEWMGSKFWCGIGGMVGYGSDVMELMVVLLKWDVMG